MGTTALLGFVGDVMVDRPDPHAPFEHVREELTSVDLLFGNQECTYTDDPHPAPSAIFPVYAPRSNADALGSAGFSVMSLANNHIVDAGHVALLETASLLEGQGIAVAGAGANLAEARSPARCDAAGHDVAVLAYASTFQHGYEARPAWPGLAPMRSENVYEAYGDRVYYRVPGAIPEVRARLVDEDAEALREDLAAVRDQVDVVVVSFHWGDVSRKFALTDHERKVARLAIDAGADIVVGHHHHTLRGVEWYAGKPIFYGLGHFVFNIGEATRQRISSISGGLAEVSDEDDDDTTYGRIEAHRGWPLLPFHKDSRLTMVAWCQVTDGAPDAVGFLPCHIQRDGSVTPHDPSSAEGRMVVDYVRDACEAEQLPVKLEVDHDVRIGRFPTVQVVDVASERGPLKAVRPRDHRRYRTD